VYLTDRRCKARLDYPAGGWDDAVMSKRPKRQFKLLKKLRRNRRHHKQRSKFVRSGVILAGFVVTLAGVVMLVTPGPAFALIPVGLYLLALEFDWAEDWLERALRHADKAANNKTTQRLVRFVKRRPKTASAILALTLTVIAALVATAFAYDVPAKLRVL
jgi:uncharacterized protein (TIGR02611 family)